MYLIIRYQGLPVEVQRSAFRLFGTVGNNRGSFSLDFRNFCRALALCCRGSREERLRFLFDLFSGASQPKHYGTGAGGGARDATSPSGAVTASMSEVSPPPPEEEKEVTIALLGSRLISALAFWWVGRFFPGQTCSHGFNSLEDCVLGWRDWREFGQPFPAT